MDDRLKNLWADLEAYIQENWIASEEEIHEVWVKIKEKWRDDDIALTNFGYRD